MREIEKLTQEQLDEILEDHRNFREGLLTGNKKGKRADLNSLDVSGLNFEGADLSFVCSENLIAVDTNFNGVLLNNTDFDDGNFLNATFKNAHVKKSSFWNCCLVNCDFEGASFDDLDLENSQIDGANFTDSFFEDVLVGSFHMNGFMVATEKAEGSAFEPDPQS